MRARRPVLVKMHLNYGCGGIMQPGLRDELLLPRIRICLADYRSFLLSLESKALISRASGVWT